MTTSGRSGTRVEEWDELLREIESLKIRLSKLSEASRLVTESLDLDVVLQEVIDGARSLTGARYGALLTHHPSGEVQDFITSGLSSREVERLGVLPRGLGLLGYMNEIREPLRLKDISSHPSSVGFPENHPPMKTFLGMPIRYRDEHVGNIYLTEKAGGQDFTGEDQDTLIMFASQAGAAIFNARRYREERQARADLEGLVNISPVGVLVFDARTEVLLSANDEARRIVGRLNLTRRTLSQILGVIALRRADGSDIPTDELPLTKALESGETVLAEEVFVHLPDGRVIATLVNARPIRRDGGDITSVIATILDITPLEAIKRQRIEFLGNVSHEVRTPLSVIKGSTATLLGSTHPLSLAETRQYLRIIDEQSDHIRRIINDLFDLSQIEAGRLKVVLEPMDIAVLLDQASEAHILQGKDSIPLDLNIPADLPRVMADRLRIQQVIAILLDVVSRSSVHTATLRIGASLAGWHVAISVGNSAEGEAPPVSLRPQGSLRRVGREVPGRISQREDMEVAISRGVVEAHGGRLWVEEADDGRGIGFTFTIPVVDEAELPADLEPTSTRSIDDSRAGMARVVAVGDEPETIRYIRSILSEAGLIAGMAGSPDEADSLIESLDPNVVLFEPAANRDHWIEDLLRLGRISDAPIIFITGFGWDQQIGRAIELGAFDYIAKPFTATELLARIEVALRWKSIAGWTAPLGRYVHGDLDIDYVSRQVTLYGRPVHLTPTEFKLLSELSMVAGRVLTHEQLLRRVWGPLHSSDSSLVRTYVKELRQKLDDDAARPTYIFTEPGVGYRMARPPATPRPRG